MIKRFLLHLTTRENILFFFNTKTTHDTRNTPNTNLNVYLK